MVSTYYPLKESVTVRRMVLGTNGYGEEKLTRGPEEPVKVFGWYITGGQEPGTDGRVNQVTYDAVLMAPSGAIGADDEVLLPQVGWCTVEGPPGNYDNGPWWTPGLEHVRLRRVSRGDY